MITFVISIKDAPEIDRATLELQISSCLRVKDACVLIGLSDNGYGHYEAWKDWPIFCNSRISLIVTRDKGLYEGWNKLVCEARTPWVSFLGFGDLILQPEHFERIGTLNANHNAVFSRVVIFGPRRSRFFGRPFRLWRHKLRQEVAFVGAVLSRDLILQMPFDPGYKIVGDYDWLLRCGPRLEAGFIPTVSAAMGAGGMSEAMAATIKLELARAKKRSPK